MVNESQRSARAPAANLRHLTREALMNRHDRLFASRLCSALLLLLLALGAVPALAQASSPTVVDRQGYINGTPLTAHTTGAVNSTNASMLVAFGSTFPSWLDLPVSIGGLSDNLGNTWNVLVGPTSWTGSTYTLMSAIYYVNAPVTGDPHTITVNLTNPGPLVVHVFALSGSDTTGPPIYSFITDPGPGPSTDVISQAITVPAATLLLAWAKNENGATATALDGWTLDPASTSFLWAEYRRPPARAPTTAISRNPTPSAGTRPSSARARRPSLPSTTRLSRRTAARPRTRTCP